MYECMNLKFALPACNNHKIGRVYLINTRKNSSTCSLKPSVYLSAPIPIKVFRNIDDNETVVFCIKTLKNKQASTVLYTP